MPSSKANGGYLTPEQISELLRDYADRRIPLKQIEADYGVRSTRIYAELQKAGVLRRSQANLFKDHLAKDTRRQLVEAYKANVPIMDIAAALGLNHDQIYVVVREERLPFRTTDRQNSSNPTFQERLSRLYADEELTVHQVAAEMGIGTKTLSRMVEKFGLPKRGRGGGNRGTPTAVALMLPELAARIAAGETVKSLANEVGIGMSTLRQKLRALQQKGPAQGNTD